MLLYRLLLTLAAPVLFAGLLLRVARGRETRADLAERLGRGRASQATGPVLWLHGASNGELTAARPLIEALLARDPARHLLVTSNTPTGRDMVRGWRVPRTCARLAPLDLRACTARLMRRHRVAALAIVENELWPNRLALAEARGLPVALVAARLSARSARRWARLRPLIAPRLAAVARAFPQDADTGARLVALGLARSALGPVRELKAQVRLPPPSPEEVAALGFARDETLLAASTHEGEEAQVLAAFLKARAARPALRLILAPRHPRRGPQVAAAIRAAGLPFATRSAGEAPGDAPVYLADTLGEMALWYAAAGTCFVGGSLVPKGGHTPWEPAAFGCAILTGPDIANAATAYARLAAADAVITVADTAALGDALAGLDAGTQVALGARARAALPEGDARALAAELEDALRP